MRRSLSGSKTKKRRLYKKRETTVYSDFKGIANVLRETRKKMGWTQKELASHVELSQQTISFIENGNFNFSFGSLVKIMRALKLKISVESQDQYPNSASASGEYSMPFKDISS